jgi:hypothetical protein
MAAGPRDATGAFCGVNGPVCLAGQVEVKPGAAKILLQICGSKQPGTGSFEPPGWS